MTIQITELSKAYGGMTVFKNVNLRLEEGGVYCLTAPSGAGKTTLLRILMGLERQDTGRIAGIEGRRIAAVFQEDRLCPELDASENIRLIRPVCAGEELMRELSLLLPREEWSKPVSEYSGGMRRRVSLLRAMLSTGEILLFDEPFNGLDMQKRQEAIEYVKKRRNGRLLLFTTHHMEEAKALSAHLICWDQEEQTWRQ
ncbi:MAG: ABC transporter ATP-binding protein [Lachnospiraceae bacterium]|jgi:NitT/TauT family transport system ATP-binding protein|nr:ABC transporter ATP-binding protein [Lachnospiraceae bacterium]